MEDRCLEEEHRGHGAVIVGQVHWQEVKLCRGQNTAPWTESVATEVMRV